MKADQVTGEELAEAVDSYYAEFGYYPDRVSTRPDSGLMRYVVGRSIRVALSRGRESPLDVINPDAAPVAHGVNYSTITLRVESTPAGVWLTRGELPWKRVAQ